ncbi:MAG: hypothetical protein WA985_05985, partial [Erythrobacter sp.]
MLASVALALLAGQLLAAVLLYRAGEERREASALASAAFQLVRGAERAARVEARGADDRSRRPGRSG